MPRIKWHKVALVLALAAICCFVFAGMALAADFSITAGTNPVTGEPSNVVKADHTYNYVITATGLNTPLNLFCDENIDDQNDKELVITFPDGFEVLQEDAVPCYLTIGDEDYYMQIVPEINQNEDGTTDVIFTFQRQQISVDGKVTGFKIDGLKVKNPTENSAEYCVKIRHTTSCFPESCMNLNVVETVGTISIDAVYQCPVAGNLITVAGKVYRTDGAGWPYNTWPVVVEVLDKDGKPAVDPQTGSWVKDPCNGEDAYINPCDGEEIEPVITHTDSNGYFEAKIRVPACPANSPYHLVARTIEVKDNKFDAGVEYEFNAPAYMVPVESIEDLDNAQEVNRNHIERGQVDPAQFDHAWLQSDGYKIEVLSGVPFGIKQNDLGSQIPLNIPAEITVTLFDKFGLETKNALLDEDCELVKQPDLKVDLAAYYVENGQQKIAGQFYLNKQDNVVTGVTNHVFIPGGDSKATVYFVPEVKGPITIEERTIINGVPKVTCCTVNVDEPQNMLEVTPKVTNDEGDPRAGWLVKVSVHYPKPATMKVELLDPQTRKAVTWATWDTEGKVQFDYDGRFESGDTFTHPNLSDPRYNSSKSDFYVYTDRKIAVGKTLVIKVVDINNNVKDEKEISFVSPVEFSRFVDWDTWQVISTPKELAGDGNMPFLLGDNYSDCLTYRDGQWVSVGTEKLQPLYAYFVLMKQPDDWPAKSKYFQADYIFNRTAVPGGTMPDTRLLPVGWNLVGVSVPDNDTEVKGDDMYQQSDYLYRMLGTTCEGCKKVYNPGGSRDNSVPGDKFKVNDLGNLAGFINADINDGTFEMKTKDPKYSAYVGDGYWLYMTKTQTLAAETQVDLVDP